VLNIVRLWVIFGISIQGKGCVMPFRKRQKLETLQQAFEYANNYVLENTGCATLGDISNGWCETWARAVKKHAAFVEVRHWQGHWFVVHDGAAYDSDTTENGFAPPG
jgi:hypothetical protein